MSSQGIRPVAHTPARAGSDVGGGTEAAARQSDHYPRRPSDDGWDCRGVVEACRRHSCGPGVAVGRFRLPRRSAFRITERGTPGKWGRDTRRPVRLARIAGLRGVNGKSSYQSSPPRTRGGEFFVHGEPLDAVAIIDISHEALIRQWRQLQDWVADEAERADDYRRWRNRATDWREGGALLAGADLSRALKWQAGQDGWQPRPSWAARYALATVPSGRWSSSRCAALHR